VDAVAACFGVGCEPVAVLPAAGDGWSVPQAAPYLQGVEPGAVTQVSVRGHVAGVVVVDGEFPVEVERSTRFSDGCPGSHVGRYLPVPIG